MAASTVRSRRQEGSRRPGQGDLMTASGERSSTMLDTPPARNFPFQLMVVCSIRPSIGFPLASLSGGEGNDIRAEIMTELQVGLEMDVVVSFPGFKRLWKPFTGLSYSSWFRCNSRKSGAWDSDVYAATGQSLFHQDLSLKCTSHMTASLPTQLPSPASPYC